MISLLRRKKKCAARISGHLSSLTLWHRSPAKVHSSAIHSFMYACFRSIALYFRQVRYYHRIVLFFLCTMLSICNITGHHTTCWCKSTYHTYHIYSYPRNPSGYNHHYTTVKIRIQQSINHSASHQRIISLGRRLSCLLSLSPFPLALFSLSLLPILEFWFKLFFKFLHHGMYKTIH